MDLTGKRPPLLASDLDGTLIPSKPTARHREAVAALAELAEEARMALAYVTGRHLELAERGVAESGLPRPDVLACDVGTTLYWWDGQAFEHDRTYRDLVAARPGIATAEEVAEAVLSHGGFRLQEAQKQGDFKVSFYFDPDIPHTARAELEERLDAGARTRLVWSRDAVEGVGLLDVLPAAVGKQTAVAYALRRLGWAEREAIFAGDSGNDRDALLAGWRAIVVGNAPEALKEEVRAGAARSGITDSVYFAAADVAEGVLEGLHHFRDR